MDKQSCLQKQLLQEQVEASQKQVEQHQVDLAEVTARETSLNKVINDYKSSNEQLQLKCDNHDNKVCCNLLFSDLFKDFNANMYALLCVNNSFIGLRDYYTYNCNYFLLSLYLIIIMYNQLHVVKLYNIYN